jgi:hypothetical protein
MRICYCVRRERAVQYGGLKECRDMVPLVLLVLLVVSNLSWGTGGSEELAPVRCERAARECCLTHKIHVYTEQNGPQFCPVDSRTSMKGYVDANIHSARLV